MIDLSKHLYSPEGAALALWVAATVVLLAHKWHARRAERRLNAARQNQDKLNANVRRMHRH